MSLREATYLLAALLLLSPVAGAQVAPLSPSAAPAGAGDAAAELALWDAVRVRNDPRGYEDYLRRYPNGRFAALAELQLSWLGSATAATPAGPGPMPPAPRGTIVEPLPPPGGPEIGSGSATPPGFVPPAEPYSATALPSGDPALDYDHAFGLLRAGDTAAAQAALSDFLQRYPGDALAPNARYWLGETYLVRGENERAAAVFGDAVRADPSATRAPDALYKEGVALSRAGRREEACRAWSELRRNYPGLESRYDLRNSGC